MNRIAIIFPGQGVQKPEIGKWLYDNFPSAKLLFEEVNDALDTKLTDIMFCEERFDQLKLTQNAQPAIMAVGSAVMQVLSTDFGLNADKFACCVAGHSLGEYTALVATNMFSVRDGAKLLHRRGMAMQNAVPLGIGGMTAILGIDDVSVIEEIAKAATGNAGICEIANDNCPGQCVLSGHKKAVDLAGALAKEKGAKAAIPLDVSVPSHCSLMSSVCSIIKDYLSEVEKKSASLPIIQNYTAKEETDPGTIANNLAAQITGRVRWRESMLSLAEKGVRKIIEVGPGSILKGLAKRTIPEVEVLSINSTSDLESAANIVSEGRG
ncbi:MAG: ACP S-malonyltransferase [Holosporales bacterium]|jgi:[acyl-carrier-protein] S-malonyltransferase|nr:ACP S-malonyltransferase [Holosporales bacterium]